MGKNLVICCDGTNNAIWGQETNVLRLFRMLEHGPGQLAFYDAGVGTRADPTAQWPWRRWIRKKLDAAIGVSIRGNVLEAYRFLVQHFHEDDSLYLFGFSRGAYTVRALAALLKRCGLLRLEHAHLAEYAWAVFTDEDRSGDRAALFGGSAKIKKVFAREVGIHFVGVWDTVSAFGWIWDQLTIPNASANDRIRHLRHGVSIDERRGCFLPNRVTPCEGQDWQEVWFAGVHADVGGGYPLLESGLARISLLWMVREAKAQGLLICPQHEGEILRSFGDPTLPDAHALAHDEANHWGWRLLGCLPRRAYSSQRGRRAWRWPNWARARRIPEGALIHESVLQRMAQSELAYHPRLPNSYQTIS